MWLTLDWYFGHPWQVHQSQINNIFCVNCQKNWLIINTLIFASKPVSLSLYLVPDQFEICEILPWAVIELPIILIRLFRTLLFLIFLLLVQFIDFVLESKNQWTSSDNARTARQEVLAHNRLQNRAFACRLPTNNHNLWKI